MKSLFLLAAILLTATVTAQAEDFGQQADWGRGPGFNNGRGDDGRGRGGDWGRGRGGDGRGDHGGDWGRGRGPGDGRGPGRGDDGRGGRDQSVTCSSNEGRPNRCNIGDGVRDVRLMRQISKSSCVEGRSWGFDRNSIWVTDGCRGEFLVSYR